MGMTTVVHLRVRPRLWMPRYIPGPGRARDTGRCRPEHVPALVGRWASTGLSVSGWACAGHLVTDRRREAGVTDRRSAHPLALLTVAVGTLSGPRPRVHDGRPELTGVGLPTCAVVVVMSSRGPRRQLLGRRNECEALDRLVASTRAGQSQVTGPARRGGRRQDRVGGVPGGERAPGCHDRAGCWRRVRDGAGVRRTAPAVRADDGAPRSPSRPAA